MIIYHCISMSNQTSTWVHRISIDFSCHIAKKNLWHYPVFQFFPIFVRQDTLRKFGNGSGGSGSTSSHSSPGHERWMAAASHTHWITAPWGRRPASQASQAGQASHGPVSQSDLAQAKSRWWERVDTVDLFGGSLMFNGMCLHLCIAIYCD